MRKPSSITWLLAAARLIGSNPLPRTALIAGAAIAATLIPHETNAATLYWRTDGTAGTWTSSIWGTTASGPFNTAWVGGSDVYFGANSTGTYASTSNEVGNVTVADNATVTLTAGGSLRNSAATSYISTYNIGTGATLNWIAQTQYITGAYSASGFIKNGAGTWNIGAQSAAYTGGFTLNAGTIIITGANSIGTGTFTINGGVISASSGKTRTANIVLGGNFENAGTGADIWSGTVALGAATRTITNSVTSGNSRSYTGIISGAVGSGLTFAGSGAGVTYIGNTGNTFSGPIAITGSEVIFNDNGAFGATTSITLDGGRLTIGTTASASAITTATIASTRLIYVGSTAGTSISIGGATGVTTYNGVIANKPSTTGFLAKQGAGTLVLGGASTYSGDTFINNGKIQLLASSSGALPSTTILNLGQASSTNLGTFDLNGQSQQIAGLVSTTGTNAAATKNTVTSATAATLTINVADGVTSTYGAGTAANSGVITGLLSLVKTGSGTQVLGDANTYTGTTTINGGILSVGSIGNGAVASGNLGSATNAAANLVLNGGTLQYTGTGTTSSDRNFTLGTSGGTIDVGAASGTFTLSGSATISGTTARTLTLTSSSGTQNGIFSGTIGDNTGATALTKTGSNTWTLSGNNTYSGATSVSAGTLTAGHAAAFGTSTITINGGTLALGAFIIANNVTLTSGTLSSTTGSIAANKVTPAAGTISAILSGAGNFAKSAAGTLTLSGVNTFTGTTTVSSGTLIANTGTLASTSGIIVNGATFTAVDYNTAATLDLNASGTATISSTAGLSVGAVSNLNTTADSLDFSGNTGGTITLASLSGAGKTRFRSAATITSNGISAGTVDVAGLLTSTLSGGTVNAGSLSSTSITGGTNTITGAAGITTFNSSSGSTTVGGVATITTLTTGTLILNGLTSSIATLNGGTITLGTNTALTVSGGDSSTGISGPTGSLVKNTSGTLTLSGTHTYGGTTTVNAGALLVNGSLANGSAVSVNNTGTLGGTGTVGAVTVNTGGTISPGNSPGTLTTGNVTFAAGGNYNWQLLNSGGAAGTGYDFISSTGSLTINATSLAPFKINLWSLSGSSTSGNATFNANANLTLTLGTFATGISGFDAANFSIVTIAANGTDGFTNSLNGAFTVAQSGNNLNLVYTTNYVASADSTYTGGAGNWSTSGNWSGSVVAINGNALIFSGTGGGVTSNDLTLDPIPSLTFSAAAGAYTLNGNALTFGVNGILNSSAVTQTIGLNLTQSANSSVTATGGALVINGSLDNADYTLSLTGASDLTTASLLGAGAITKSGDGTLTLNGTVATNTFNVSQGTLLLGAADRLANTATLTGSGSATINLGGYTDTIATYNQSGTATLTNGTLTAANYNLTGGTISGNLGDGTLTAASGTTTLSGSIGATTVTVSGGTLSTSAANRLADTATINLSSGTLTLGGNDTVGALSLSGGTLSGTSYVLTAATYALTGGTVNAQLGAGAITVTTGTTTLGSSGRLNSTATLAINSGTLSLGGNETVSTLTLAGGTLSGTGTLTATTYDLNSGTLSANLGAGTLNLNATQTLSVTSSATVVNVTAGTITLGSANRFTGTPAVTLTAGTTLNLGGNQTIGSLAGTGSLANAVASSILTTGGANTSTDFGGTLSGVGGLTKTGSGNQTLSNANTFSGATLISGGSLTAIITGALGSTSGITVNGATLSALDYNTNSTLTLDTTGTATISGTGLTIAGAVTNNNTTASALNFNNGSGTITLASLAGAGSTRFGSNATITGGISAGTVTVAGLLTSTLSGGTVNANTLSSSSITGGTNTITNTASITTFNSSSGSTTVNGVATITTLTTGTLNLNGATSSVTTLNGGTITLGNTALTVSAGTSAGNISGLTGSLIFTGGTVTLSGTNTYGGGTTVNTGTLVIGATTALPTSGSIAINAASSLSLNIAGTFGGVGQSLTLNANQATTPILSTLSGAAVTLLSNITLTDGTTNRIEANGALGSLTLAGNFTGSGNLLKQASGNLVLSGTANTNTGTTSIGNGTLTVNTGSALGTGNLTLSQTSTNATTVILNNAAQSIGTLTSSWAALTGTIAQTLTLNSTTLTINQSADSTFGVGSVATLTSVITGTGSIIKEGTGTLTLTSANSYSGATTVNAGTLVTSGAGVISGDITVASGATLTLGTVQTITSLAANGTVNVNVAETLGSLSGSGAVNANAAITVANTSPAVSSFTGTFTGSSALNKSGTGTLSFGGNNSSSYSGAVNVSGGVVKAAATGALGSGTVTLSAGSVLGGNGATTTNNIVIGTAATSETLSYAAAANLLTWDFDTVTGTTFGPQNMAPTVMDANLTSSGLTRGSGLGTSGTSTAKAWGGSGFGITGGTTSSVAITNNDFITFTITAASKLLNLGSILAYSSTKSGSGPTNFLWQYKLGSVDADPYTDITTIATGSVSTAFSLSSITALQGIAAGTTVTFRLVGYGASATGGNGYLKDITSNAADFGISGQIGSGTAGVAASGTGTLGMADVGTTTFSTGSITVYNTATLDATQSDSIAVFQGVITGAGAITKTGAGIVKLSGANDFSGGLTISAGTLQVGDAGTTGTLGSATVTNNAILKFNRSNSYTVSNTITGSGSLVQDGVGGTTILTGSNTYGTTTITNGTLQIGSGTTGTLGSGAVTNNATLKFARTNSYTVSNDISGTGSLVQDGVGGTTILTGTNSYDTTTITNGTLQVGNGGTTGSLGSGAVTNNATLTINRSNSYTVANAITGTGGLIINGNGTLTLSGANNYTGAMTLNGGKISVNSLGTGAGTSAMGASTLSDVTKLVINGGTIEYTGTGGTYDRSLTVGDGTLSLISSGSGALILSSTANIDFSDTDGVNRILSLSGANLDNNKFAAATFDINDIGTARVFSQIIKDGVGTWILSGPKNRFRGDIRVNGGTLGFETGSLPDNQRISMADGAVLRWEAGNTDDISGKLNPDASSNVVLKVNGGSVTFAMDMIFVGAGATSNSSTARVTKSGASDLNITSSQSFTGGFTINAGKLIASAAGSLGTGKAIVNSSGTLAVGGDNSATDVDVNDGGTLMGTGSLKSVRIMTGGTLSPGASPGSLVTDSLILGANSNFQWQVYDASSVAGTGWDKIRVTQNLDLSGVSSAGTRISVNVMSLSNFSDTLAGNAVHWNKDDIHTFLFGNVGGITWNTGIGTNISDYFSFDTSAFTTSDNTGIHNSLWSMSYNSGTGDITLTAVPEPSTYGLAIGALAFAIAAIRRRKRQEKKSESL